jgi:hypothetical protein
MRTRMIAKAVALLAGGITLSLGATASAQPAATREAARYSVTTTLVGKLLDDPAAAAILKQFAPTVYANPMFQTEGRTLALKDIQQFESVALSDAVLAKIQAEFDKIPVKD